MRLGADLFDERAFLAEFYLGAHLFAEVQGRAEDADAHAARANFIDGELRRAAGL